MLRRVTKLVDCPKNIVSSLVRLKRAKERLNLIREMLAGGTVNATLEIGSGFAEGEVDVLHVRCITQTANGDSGKIKGGTQILDSGNCALCQHERQSLGKSEFMELVDAVSVRLSNQCVWCTLEKASSAPFKLGDVFLSPSDSRARVSKCVPHQRFRSILAT
jgi:hypothetical protein